MRDKQERKKACPFCSGNLNKIADGENCFAIRDGFPVSEGHTLIISRHHVSDFCDLTEEEQTACLEMSAHIRKELEKEYRPDGFNIGINIGRAAGQTVFHCHIHVIPRYEGDMEDPRGGVRHCVEGKGRY